ncbi:hypothetical protein PBY51_013350 [Eleginops maclovinus]|uniref:Telomeric repeat-binding factor 2-interacting protein 1 n=1 Tax=Eleginops maclovinus TaxID=56733 RepID=A0AAN7XYX6_ELEMC|nr:hypothetical protein PBY51_013350 [Eleginops maclovinus]
MPSEQQDEAISDISPVLFMTVDGEPMSFFLRPGPAKCKLQPLIAAGGGILSNVQRPRAILLIDPEEKVSIPEITAHWYVSTQYIHDCIEKEEQLNLKDYRLIPEVAQRQSVRLNNKKTTSCRLSGGRLVYTAEEDEAMLSYINKRQKEVGGNRLWQEMEKQRVTSHSWQSMKYHYRVRLANKQPEVLDVKTEEATKTADGDVTVEEETDGQKPTCGAASPQGLPAVTDLTQIDAQPIPAEDTQPQTPKSIPPEEEVQPANPKTDKQPAESKLEDTAQAETSNSSESEGLDPHTDAPPIQTENAETIISPEKEIVPEDTSPAQLESPPGTPLQKKHKEKQKASPKLEKPKQRPKRCALVLEGSTLPGSYGKKLRSASPPPGRQVSSPQLSKKSTPKKAQTVEQPPAKKARGSSVTVVAEEPQEESRQVPVSEIAPTESNSVPQEVEKKKKKRKLGILELATKEFDDESESDEEVSPDLQNPSETPTVKPTSTEPPLPTAVTASTPPNPADRADLQDNTQDAQASSSRPETGCPEPAATEAVNSSSKAHLFIFDSETQEEEDSQSIVGDNRGAPSEREPAVNKDAAFSLTQVQLEEDKKRIQGLMNQTDQDIISVTKALLRTSGDFSAALDQLLNPSSVLGPLWSRCDDSLLLSADPVVRQQLQEKYSEEDVAKRIVFLELEG